MKDFLSSLIVKATALIIASGTTVVYAVMAIGAFKDDYAHTKERVLETEQMQQKIYDKLGDVEKHVSRIEGYLGRVYDGDK